MTAIKTKIAKALGKNRMSKVADIFDDGRAIDTLSKLSLIHI